MPVYTVEEIAAILKIERKTVLRLIQRGSLIALPGIRHKRVTQAELDRYLDVRQTIDRARAQASPAIHNGSGQAVVPLTGHSTRSSAVDGVSKGPIVVNLNGEGRGAASRLPKPKERNETTNRS